MVVYIASHSPLPLIPWQENAPAFNVKELTEHEQSVLRHFPLLHVRQAGSHTSCGCGFNERRGDLEFYDNPESQHADALESSSLLARYIREHQVEQIYSCWSGDEDQPKMLERHIRPDDLVAPDFIFRERELLFVEH